MDSPATCLNTWKAEHRRKILFSLEEKEIGRAQNEKSKEYFSVGWRGFRAVAGLASLLGVLLKKCSNFAQKARNELVEIETKLDRLLDLQLDGNLSQAEYTAKKHKLILAKKDLEEKISSFGRKSNNRFELAIAFLKDANQAEKYAQQENPERIRDFLKKIGSNFRLSGQKLFLDFKFPFKITAEAEPRQRRGEATIAQNPNFENWRRGRDSNSRSAFTDDSFQDCSIKPLWHLSNYFKTNKINPSWQ